MKSTIIEKANQTHGEDEVWKIIDEQERRQVTVIFSKKLENDFHRRNHSFERLQSEQLNAVLRVMNQLEGQEYVLEINKDSIGNSIIPLTQEKLLQFIKLI